MKMLSAKLEQKHPHTVRRNQARVITLNRNSGYVEQT